MNRDWMDPKIRVPDCDADLREIGCIIIGTKRTSDANSAVRLNFVLEKRLAAKERSKARREADRRLAERESARMAEEIRLQRSLDLPKWLTGMAVLLSVIEKHMPYMPIAMRKHLQSTRSGVGGGDFYRHARRWLCIGHLYNKLSDRDYSRAVEYVNKMIRAAYQDNESLAHSAAISLKRMGAMPHIKAVMMGWKPGDEV